MKAENLLNHIRQLADISDHQFTNFMLKAKRNCAQEEGQLSSFDDRIVGVAARNFNLSADQRTQIYNELGFERICEQVDLTKGEKSALHRAITHELDKAMPFPAMVLDPYLNMVMMNPAMETFCAMCKTDILDDMRYIPNLLRACFIPDRLAYFLPDHKRYAASVIADHLELVGRAPGIDHIRAYLTELLRLGDIDDDLDTFTARYYQHGTNFALSIRDMILDWTVLASQIMTQKALRDYPLYLQNYIPANPQTETFSRIMFDRDAFGLLIPERAEAIGF